MDARPRTDLQAANETPEQPQMPDDKLEYTAPELKEHGSAKDVTLQTFFGSFSP